MKYIFVCSMAAILCSPNLIAKNPTQVALQLIKTGNEIYLSRPDSAEKIVAFIKRQALQQKNYKNLAEGYYLQAKISRRVHKQYDSALIQYYQAVDYFNKIGNDIGIAKSLNGIGLCYQETYNDHYAIKYYLEEIKYRKKTGNKKFEANANHNIGNSFSILDKQDSALNFYQKALEIYTALAMNKELINCYLGIGRSHFKLKQYAKAEQFFQLAFENSKKPEDSFLNAAALSNLGSIFLVREKHDHADSLFKIAQIKLNNSGNSEYLIYTDYNLGVLAQKKGDLESARDYFNRVIEFPTNGMDLAMHINAYEELINMAADMDKAKYYGGKLSEFLAPFAGKMAFYEKLHQSYKTRKIKYAQEKRELLIANLNYELWIYRLVAICSLLLGFGALMSYYAKHFKKSDQENRNLVDNLKTKTRTLNFIVNRFGINMSTVKLLMKSEKGV